MADGSIRIGTKIDFSGVKKDIKALEKELATIQKETDKLNAQEKKVIDKYNEDKEFDAQFPAEMSHREMIDKEASKKLEPIIKEREYLNEKAAEYNALLDEANAKLQQQSAISQASKELSSAVKAESVLDKITTQEQYNSLLEETRAKMASIEKLADSIATKNGVSKDQVLSAYPEYQKLQDTMSVLENTTRKFAKESKEAGDKASSGLKKAKKEANGFSTAIMAGIKKVSMLSLAVFGIRGAYRAVRMAVTEYLSTNEKLAGQIETLKAGFGQVLGPAIEQIVNLLMKAISIVNAFVQALTGINFVAKANAAALKKQEKAASSSNSTAGFDEQTTLSSSSGSANSSGSGVGTLPDGSNIDVSFLDPIANAIKKFGEDISPFLSTLKDLGGWVLENVLKPLGEWASTTLLPTTLDLIAAAFNFLNEVLLVLQPLGEWFWDNFLKPIAEWTGGVIIDVLTGLTNLLDRFAEWISNNQEPVQVFAGVVATFMAAWEVTSLIMWIDKMGGIPGILDLVTSKLWGNVAAKIASKAEDMAIIALYVKDYIVAFAGQIAKIASSTAAWIANTAAKIASTAAEWAQIAATTAWNVICAVATAVTTAFGAAMAFLTSPIGLVILAIAAIIAIIVLLIKYWDEIKEAAIACWDWIERVWCSVANWFDDNVIQPVAKFFTGMWDGVKNGAKKAWDGIKSVFSGVATFFKNTFENAWNGVKNVFSKGGKIFDGIKDGIVTAFKTVVNAIIEGINKVVKLPFEGLNGILNTLSGLSIAGIKPFGWLTWRAPIPQLPKLAVGGIVNRPGRGVPAIIGEAGAEAVLPLENNTEWMDILAEKIGGNVTIPIYMDGKKIATYVVDIQKKKAFAMNGA